ncbi:hypothetical protein J2Y65_003318 [Aeromonas salmonicida]|nr:hypothetical protein [Aeromonas salmonicida]MDR7021987.1 hypothetical protein [Aeromonas salmonicida]
MLVLASIFIKLDLIFRIYRSNVNFSGQTPFIL